MTVLTLDLQSSGSRLCMHYAQPEEIPDIDALSGEGFGVERVALSGTDTVIEVQHDLAGLVGLGPSGWSFQGAFKHFATKSAQGMRGFVLIAQSDSTRFPGIGLQWLEQIWPPLAQELSDTYDFPFHLVRIFDDPGQTSFIPPLVMGRHNEE